MQMRIRETRARQSAETRIRSLHFASLTLAFNFSNLPRLELGFGAQSGNTKMGEREEAKLFDPHKRGGLNDDGCVYGRRLGRITSWIFSVES